MSRATRPVPPLDHQGDRRDRLVERPIWAPSCEFDPRSSRVRDLARTLIRDSGPAVLGARTALRAPPPSTRVGGRHGDRRSRRDDRRRQRYASARATGRLSASPACRCSITLRSTWPAKRWAGRARRNRQRADASHQDAWCPTARLPHLGDDDPQRGHRAAPRTCVLGGRAAPETHRRRAFRFAATQRCPVACSPP
jgi:hypothetical protein